AILTASVQKCLESTDPFSIVLAASMRVLFFLSATPFCPGFILSKALAKKQAPFGVSDDMSRTYTSFLLGAIRTISLLALKIVPCLSSNYTIYLAS
ncbi:hypothetical protein Tco_1333340, partial [Tanacetum coccineum]